MIINTSTSYGTVAKTFHWLTALLIFTMIPLGIIAQNAPFDTNEALARKALLFSTHKTLGIVTLAVALARILWAIAQAKPGAIHPTRRAETFLATLVHWLLYGSLVLVPLTGWISHAATEGFAPIWLPVGQNLPFVPESERVAEVAAALHIIFERVLVASVLLHVAGAIKHVIIDRDGTLARMWFGDRNAGDGQPHPSSLTAPILAVAIWTGAIGIGAGLGIFARQTEAATGPALVDVSSDWAVTDGSLGISVVQLGSDVGGAFADWTAAITFDPETGAGSVDVTVAIGSLTLGSVTGQALGPDFLDASTFPTATFAARITPDGDAFVAEGPLAIRGIEIPVRLPFTLSLAGDVATVSGSLEVDRRDFEVGLTMQEGNLGYPVSVEVSLTAERGAKTE